MAVAKRPGREKPRNRRKEGPRTRVRTSDKTNSTPGQPKLYRAGPGGGEKKKKTT